MYERSNSTVAMIVHKGILKSCLRSRQRLCTTTSMCLAIFVMTTVLISTTSAIKCYVCGSGSEQPFLDAKSSNINATSIRQKIHKSCDEFDRIALAEKYKYEVECPDGYHGCHLNVGETVQRTCSELSVDDCKTVNQIHYCYCNRELCNGQNAESIIESLGDIVVGGDDEDSENGNPDEASGSDEDGEEDYDYRKTSQKIDDFETATLAFDDSDETQGNDYGTTATKPKKNKAVNSNLSRNLLISLTFVHLIIVYHQN